MRRLSIILSCVILVTGCVVSLGKVEEPVHRVENIRNAYEIRQYSPRILATVTLSGTREQVADAGFKILYDYISKGNIKMTAPVLQQVKGPNEWRVSFVMPQQYRLKTLPKPADSRIKIVVLPMQRVAALTFSGLVTDAVVTEKSSRLTGYLSQDSLIPAENPMLARYDPPWTLPFLRRNEILIVLQ